MLTYKNQLKTLILPEYGRNIQNMVDHCLTIEDREERTRCARSIVDAMSILFPAQGDQASYRRKLWDHLAIMSGFALDVDLPFELLSSELFSGEPEPVAYGNHKTVRRQYGVVIEEAIKVCAEMPEGPEREELAFLLADHMKKLLSALNPDGVEDVRVFSDLYDISEGRIHLDPADVRLHDFVIIAPPTKKKRKK